MRRRDDNALDVKCTTRLKGQQRQQDRSCSDAISSKYTTYSIFISRHLVLAQYTSVLIISGTLLLIYHILYQNYMVTSSLLTYNHVYDPADESTQLVDLLQRTSKNTESTQTYTRNNNNNNNNSNNSNVTLVHAKTRLGQSLPISDNNPQHNKEKILVNKDKDADTDTQQLDAEPVKTKNNNSLIESLPTDDLQQQPKQIPTEALTSPTDSASQSTTGNNTIVDNKITDIDDTQHDKDSELAQNTTENTISIDSPWWQPMNCQHFLDQVENNVYDVAPIDSNHSISIDGLYPFEWSVHLPMLNNSYTPFKYKSSQFRDIIMGIIRNSPLSRERDKAETIFIDVGANTGFFSIFAAQQGQQVYTFESNYSDLCRLCESKMLNNISSAELEDGSIYQGNTISIIPATVSDHENNLNMTVQTNAGTNVSSTVVMLDSFATSHGWFTHRPYISILKVSCPDSNCSAVLGAKNLIRSGLVKHVFIKFPIDNSSESMLELMVSAGYHLHRVGGYVGFQGTYRISPWPNDDQLVRTLTNNKRNRGKEIKMWWTLHKTE